MSNNNNSLNKKQRQWIYDTIVSSKETYSQPGTVAFAILSAVCSIGSNGLHIASIEGLHRGCWQARSKDHSIQAMNYLTHINKVLRRVAGDRAPKLVMDALGDRRVRWILAAPEETTETET